jgi:mRNA-degrading endonuclease RelE of RelBE toxin-antitoxin system
MASWPTRKLRTKKRITKLNKSLPGPQADAYKRADYKSVGKKLRTYLGANYKFRVGEYRSNM